jgi:GT2 family glycosyltransferase
VRLSVIICSRDRAASLTRALESLAACEPPRCGWEVVVVDNASRDRTAEVLAAFRTRLPLRWVVEPRPGLSRARNAGVAAAGGEYLLWTDDDVTVCRSWLTSYEAGIERHPNAAFLGGPIRPCFEGVPPSWLGASSPVIQTAFAGIDLGPEPILLTGGARRLPFAANLAVRGREQRAIAFDPRLGRQPGRLVLGGEEMEVLRQILAAGGSGVWLPDAAVEHWIDPARQTEGYLRRYYVGVGIVGAERALAEGGAPRARERLRLLLRFSRQAGLYLAGRVSGRTEVWTRALRNAAVLWGWLRVHGRRLAAGRPRPVAP